MNILHLSDIHIPRDDPASSIESQSLIDYWVMARKIFNSTSFPCPDRVFDFIVISGDIAQIAENEEYKEAEKFIHDCLRNHLKNKNDLSRVIIVPGNHDIERGKSLEAFDTSSWLFNTQNSGNSADFNIEVIHRIQKQGHRDKRFSIAKDGIHLHSISDLKKYQKRFEAFQEFYDSFYRDAIRKKDGGIHMDLLASPESGLDYSIHIFPDEKIIFVGLNSCHKLDVYNWGASINSKALTKARASIEKIANNQSYLIIGVWHHGVHSKKLRSDFLDFGDLREIKKVGLHFGLHGHTHEAHLTEVKKLNGFPVWGTGSLTAKAKDRPIAIGNQLSIIEIDHPAIHIETFDYKEDLDKWDPKREDFSLQPESFPLSLTQRSFHSRAKACVCRWDIDAEGVAHINNTYIDLKVESKDQIPIASFYYSHGVAKSNGAYNSTGKQEFTVPHTDEIDDKIINVLTYSPLDIGNYQSLSCLLRISNQVVLSKEEFKYRSLTNDGRRQGLATVSALTWLPVSKLVIELRLPMNTIVSSLEAKINKSDLMIERPLFRYGKVVWEEIENHKGTPTVSEDGRLAKIEIEAPLPGLRYSLLYEPKLEGLKLSQNSQKFLSSLVKRCRKIIQKPSEFTNKPIIANKPPKRNTSKSIEVDFPRAMTFAMLKWIHYLPTMDACGKNELADPPERGDISDGKLEMLNGTDIIGLFWCSNSTKNSGGKLCFCFGNCTIEKKQDCFNYGEGIAGHAFRFNKIVAWYRCGSIIDNKSVIYVERDSDYEWIVCVPIGIKDEAPIGVLSIAHRSGASYQAGNSFLDFFSGFAENVHNTHLAACPSNINSQTSNVEIQNSVDRVSTLIQAVVQQTFWGAITDFCKKNGDISFGDCSWAKLAKLQQELWTKDNEKVT